jgi:hypothetical protein
MIRAAGLLAMVLACALATAAPPRVALVVGENEYRTWETLPTFARQELAPLGWQLEWVQASPRPGDGIFTNHTALAQVDLVVLSVRRRPLPAAMHQALQAHLAAGRPAHRLAPVCPARQHTRPRRGGVARL